MVDDLSNFKSAIVWPDERQPDEAPTGEFMPLSMAMVKAIESAVESFAMSGVTESPIETIFGAKLALVLRPVCEELGWDFTVGEKLGADLVLYPQYPLQRFRYDFAVIARGQTKPIVLVECDGKDFHSTPQQQANDRLKDVAALKAGIRLVRFSGSEINGDVDSCVRQTLAACVSAALQ
ncbi:endonuclease domain-containing protein [Bradyrhizobium sp. USDA 4451]